MNNGVHVSPRTVTIGVAMLGIRQLYNFIIFIYLMLVDKTEKIIPNNPIDSRTMYIVGNIIIFLSWLFFIFCIYKIYKGKNWARITYIVLYLMALFGSIPRFTTLFRAPESLAHPVTMGYLNLLGYSVELIALILLFSRSGGSWFKRDHG